MWRRCFFLEHYPWCKRITHLFTYDPTCPKFKKPRKAKWELNKIFQDIWATKWSWDEVVMGPTSKMFMVRCKICTFVKKRNKLFVPKFDGLQLHVGWHNNIVAKVECQNNMSASDKHAKKKCQFTIVHSRCYVIH
jgi:hypothetical protein